MSFLVPILATVITSVADLRDAVWSNVHTGAEFAVTCTVTATFQPTRSCTVKDGSGYCYLRATNLVIPKVGCVIYAKGRIGIDKYNWQRAFVEDIKAIGVERPPQPIAITAQQLNDESFDNRSVTMSGIVTDVIRDEIDPAWRFLVLRSESGPFLAAVGFDTNLENLVGAKISAHGIANVLPDGGQRKFKTPQLTISDIDGIAVDVPAPPNPFSAPCIPTDANGIENLKYKSAALISQMGYRKAIGDVIAVFAAGRKLLVRTRHGHLVGVELLEPGGVVCGEHVTVAGFPETDLFILKLVRAKFRSIDAPTHISPPPHTHTVATLPCNFDMDEVLRNRLGALVKVSGIVIAADSRGMGNPGILVVSCGRNLVPVDASALLRDTNALPAIGSTVEITGVCVFNSTNWTPRSIFPRIGGFTLVPRTMLDITVTVNPPWWTPKRLFAAIAILLLILLLVMLWNHVLRRLIEQRGRQLFNMEIEKVESDLRVDERTRLAAELHDSIAQTLTGVAFQIDAAGKTLHEDLSATAGFLDVAKRTLLSCREELRRCLWDLRNYALEEPDIQEAIKKTIKPHIGDAVACVRFHTRRSQLSDTTVHNILSVIRELCVNAIRHGHARHIRIAGDDRDVPLRFSVWDDGDGFIPAERPDPSQGHFGLQGVKERIQKLHGIVRIESEPGKGTKVTVEIEKK